MRAAPLGSVIRIAARLPDADVAAIASVFCTTERPERLAAGRRSIDRGESAAIVPVVALPMHVDRARSARQRSVRRTSARVWIAAARALRRALRVGVPRRTTPWFLARGVFVVSVLLGASQASVPTAWGRLFDIAIVLVVTIYLTAWVGAVAQRVRANAGGRSPVTVRRSQASSTSHRRSPRSATLGGLDELTVESTEWRPPPHPPPILPERTSRAIVVALASAPIERTPEAAELVESSARRSRFQSKARRVNWSCNRGLDLYVDQSGALEPFASDIDDLVRCLEGAVGRDRVRLIGFERDPNRLLRPLEDPLWAEAEFMTMNDVVHRSGTPAVVVSDLGIARPQLGPISTSSISLRQHRSDLRRRGLFPLFLTPYSPARWHRGLVHLNAVSWDERLTARAVRRAREREISS